MDRPGKGVLEESLITTESAISDAVARFEGQGRATVSGEGFSLESVPMFHKKEPASAKDNTSTTSASHPQCR